MVRRFREVLLYTHIHMHAHVHTHICSVERSGGNRRRKVRDREAGRQTDRQTYRQTDRQTGKHTDRQEDKVSLPSTHIIQCFLGVKGMNWLPSYRFLCWGSHVLATLNAYWLNCSSAHWWKLYIVLPHWETRLSAPDLLVRAPQTHFNDGRQGKDMRNYLEYRTQSKCLIHY